MGWIIKIVLGVMARFRLLTLSEKAGLLTAGGSLADTILTKLVGHDLKREAFSAIVEEAAERTGLQLNPDDPFSDASLAGALSQRMGITIRSVKNREMIVEDVEDFAVGRVSERLGFTITSLRDTVRLRQEFEFAALGMLTQKTGIPFQVPDGGLSAEGIKGQVEDWARARIVTELSGSATEALAVLGGQGVDFESLAAEMNGKLAALGSDMTVSEKGLALKVAESLVASSMAKFGAVAIGAGKRSRRQMQVREAQRKFRAVHGNRQKYVPLGMSAVIE